MKILGAWRRKPPFHINPAPFVVARLICPELGINRPSPFLIDTGASSTTILDDDTERLDIDYGRLRRAPSRSRGIGGSVEAYLMPNVTLQFRTLEGVILNTRQRPAKNKPLDKKPFFAYNNCARL